MTTVGRTILLALTLAFAANSFFACRSSRIRNRSNEVNLPRVMLWAWERPEDLRFLNSRRYGVAALAQTLVLKDDDVIQKPRHHPLLVPPDVKVVAVTRIESQRSKDQRPTLSASQTSRVAQLIRKSLELPNVYGVQVDFDATTSEREFYRALLGDLRATLPDETPLSITALASFCVGDRWLKDLPVDEAIPMAFRMGTDSTKIRGMLADGNDFRGELCQRSYGIALDEPLKARFDPTRRVYVFNSRSWKESDLEELEERVRQ
ncbi:MAG TPA: DUF3142 domain-containing protein [Pyrinomonadaceae bacterium]|nr:DUF3142 domain-containing protein [Pyrinomonadaceae bacterium]